MADPADNEEPVPEGKLKIDVGADASIGMVIITYSRSMNQIFLEPAKAIELAEAVIRAAKYLQN